MALSGYEKQKRWREKNRALYNLQQRNRRKGVVGGVEKREVASPYVPETKRALVSQAAPPSVPKSKIEELRELVKAEQEKPRMEASVKPQVYRNDFGGVISRFAWDKLQKLKEKAKEGGYILDEYSQ